MDKRKRRQIVMLVDAWFPKKSGGQGVFGGGQVHVWELKKRLTAKYHLDVAIFFPAHPNIFIRSLWTVYVIPKVLLWAKTHPPSLIHSHGFNSGIPAKICSLVLKVPVIHTVHGSALMDQNLRQPKAWLEKLILTKIRYDGQISVAKRFLTYPNVNRVMAVIPNGVDVQAFNAIRVKKYANPSLIWVGRDDRVKGLTVLKQAIQKVRKVMPNLKSNLVTGGRLRGKALIKAYKRAHVFVLSSLAEGQPITLLEAWAAKLPVVVTAVGDNPDMVVDGVNGYLVEPGKVNPLAAAIIRVLRARTKDRQMGLSGYRLVKKNYSWEMVASQTFAFYQRVMQNYTKA